jgi:hypothetical protein
MLTLKTSDGQTFDAKAGPDVDLNRIHVGDSVQATYYEEIAVAIRPSGKTAPKTTQTTVQREGVTAQQATMTAKVVSVDAEKKMVTLRDAQGKTHAVKVQDPDLPGPAQSRQGGRHGRPDVHASSGDVRTAGAADEVAAAYPSTTHERRGKLVSSPKHGLPPNTGPSGRIATYFEARRGRSRPGLLRRPGSLRR